MTSDNDQAEVRSFRELITGDRAVQLLDRMAQGVVFQDATGAIVVANTAAQEILGLTLDQLQGRTSYDPGWRTVREDGRDLPDDERPPTVALKTRLSVRDVVMGVYNARRGEMRWLLVNSAPQFADTDPAITIGVLSTFEDITRLKELELELRRSEERFRIAAECSSDILFEWDLSTNQIEYFGAVRATLPEARRATLADWVSHLDPAERDDIVADVYRHVDSGELFSREVRLEQQDGEWMHVSVRALSVRDRSGKPARFIGAATDITERRETDSRMREALNLFEAVIEGTADPVFVKNREGRYLLVNSAAATRMNMRPLEIIGRTTGDLFEADYAERADTIEQIVMDTGEPTTYEAAGLGGEGRYDLVTKTPYRDASGKIIGIIGVLRDVSEMRRLEEEYRQVQKMEAVGRLAGGIAHDFNNLLTVILGYADELQATAGEAHREALLEVKAAAERATQLTAQLLAFSRRQVLQPRPTDLNTLIGDIERMLVRILGEDIQLRTALAPDLAIVTVDPGQFQQVVLNLVVNARDAMPTGGRLLVETANLEITEALRHQHPSVPLGSYVSVSISDTGVGMDRVTMSRIFEPFFTTKGRGGTGLGLATVYGIVKQSEGDIWVTSEVGRGTTFRILLPCADAAKREASQPVRAPAGGGTESILLVEDDDSLRELLASVLRRHGYDVTVCENTAVALERLRAKGGRVDLLITDVVMPNGTGPELAKQVRREYPRVRIMFMSGYAEHAALSSDAFNSDTPFLQKPFTPSVLAKKIREILGK
jgi:two-component system, cell cycle sensor histidine kinase and response regulator CckA